VGGLTPATLAVEEHEKGQVLVGGEAVFGASLDEHGLSFLKRHRLALDLERPTALEHEVDLVVLVGLLAIRLGRDENVHADLDPFRLVYDFVAAGLGREPLLDALDVEAMHGGERTT
jgi:hypothetical protein